MSAGKPWLHDLEEQGYLEKIEDYTHNVGTCYRCHNDVEPHDLRPVVRKDGSLWRRRPSGW